MKISRRRSVGVFGGLFDEFAGLERGAGADEGGYGALTARQRSCAALDELERHGQPGRSRPPTLVLLPDRRCSGGLV